MGRRSQTSRLRCAPERRPNKVIPLLSLGIRREMEGKLPPFIEVRSPIIETRLKIDIPESADGDFFRHDNLVALCTKTLSTVRDWEVIIKKRLAEGAHMELAWRLDTNLDWIWWLDDIHDRPRSWAVLAGLALNQVHSISFSSFFSLTTLALGGESCATRSTLSRAHGPAAAC